MIICTRVIVHTTRGLKRALEVAQKQPRVVRAISGCPLDDNKWLIVANIKVEENEK